MKLTRKSGILLHPTSLPGPAGIGTFGKCAFDFVNFLSDSGVKLWQVLPLGPTGYGDSPYQSFSTFALNPLLIDFDDLVEKNWAVEKDCIPPKWIKKRGAVDYGAVTWWKKNVLNQIADKFLQSITNPDGGELDLNADELSDVKANFFTFCRENMFWLRDYAAFISIKAFYDAQAEKEREKTGEAVASSWTVYWPKKLARHNQAAVEQWINAHTEDFLRTEVIQFFASVQWQELREYANKKNVEIIGDIPIFVSPDSSDVWANQKLFQFDTNGQFKNVAGVPPDYFSATGQLWGNPLYDWKKMKSEKYAWWVNRIKKLNELYDCIRIDHFRGFESYWAVPFGSENATSGEWLKGPGKELFDTIRKELGDLPLIAEDLGIITDEVRALRDETGLPGMKVLQFAFDKNERDGLKNAFLPHNFENPNCVVYTGTHDNDTTQGAIEKFDAETQALIASYVSGEDVSQEKAQKMIRSKSLTRRLIALAFESIAAYAIVPLQDVYALGSSSRMNTPSTAQANWAWRADEALISGDKAEKAKAWLRKLNALSNR